MKVSPFTMLFLRLTAVTLLFGLFGCGGAAQKKEPITPAVFSVSSTTPASGANSLSRVLTITFNREVDAATVNGANISLDNGLSGAFTTVGNQVTIATSAYTASTLYTVSVGTGVQDLNGDPLASPHSFSFTATSSLLAGVQANYHLNGDVADSSGNNRNLTNYGLGNAASGHIDGAMSGNGSTAYARITSYDFSAGDTSDVTVSFWMKRVDGTAVQVPAAVGGTNDSLMQAINYWDGTNPFIQAGFGYMGSSPILVTPLATFQHVVLEFDVATRITTLWLNNGVSPVSFDGSGPNPTYGNRTGSASGGLILFASQNLSSVISNHFQGDLDEVVVWSRKLTTAERTELYNGGTGVPIP